MNGPRLIVPRTPQTWDRRVEWTTWDWGAIPALPPFILADGSGPAEQQTVARVCYDSRALYVRFDCDDRDIWGTFYRRDQPIYAEEVVELFIGVGEEDPVRYYEFEISPNAALFDAEIYNPTPQRRDMVVDVVWNCREIKWHAERRDDDQLWWAMLAIPWDAIKPSGPMPPRWRANFCRIERPHDGPPEFSSWSPTKTEPADFHKPAFFGTLELTGDLTGFP